MLVSEPNAEGTAACASARGRSAERASYAQDACDRRASRLDDAACFRRAVALVVVLLTLFMVGCAGEGGDTPLVSTTTTLAAGGVTLAQLQTSIFTPSCATVGCHDAATQAGSLRLTDEQTSYDELVGVASTCAARVHVIPGDPDASYLLHKLGDGPAPCGSLMPVGAPTLGASELQDVRDWITAGAPAPSAQLVAGGSTTTSSTLEETIEEEPR